MKNYFNSFALPLLAILFFSCAQTESTTSKWDDAELYTSGIW